MPTTNPRINVTLTPSLDALVQRMSACTRTSKAQVLRELLEAAEPALQRAVALMEAANQAVGAVKADLAQGMDEAQAKAERDMAHFFRAVDTMTGDLVAQAESVRERRPARRGVAAAAPASQAKQYSAVNPVTGKRELLPVGKAFGRSGAVVDVAAPASNTGLKVPRKAKQDPRALTGGSHPHPGKAKARGKRG